MHLKKFKSWNVDERVLQVVKGTCFKWFLDIQDAPQRWQMISALIRFYNKDKNCFMFPEDGQSPIYLDFGLEDILHITRLPIDGLHVSGRESVDVVGVIKEHLNIDEAKANSLLLIKHNKKCEQINPSFLKRDFEEVPEDADLEPYVKAYLLYLLGTAIFPNNSNCFHECIYHGYQTRPDRFNWFDSDSEGKPGRRYLLFHKIETR
ncbi:hypothetical protein M5689_006628 [Euphorbia peplus]|nr:hypothetical protein M5689_006628 [Euphorbia peplus]